MSGVSDALHFYTAGQLVEKAKAELWRVGTWRLVGTPDRTRTP
jgi:hypothetical protein